MLYKDDQPYKLQKEEVKKYSGKKIYRLAKNLVKWDAEDQRIRKPNSLMLEPFYTFNDIANGRTEVIRYTTSAREKKDGNLTYTAYMPSEVAFPVTGKIVIENNPEYAFWFDHHPNLDGGINKDPKKPSLFFLENKAKEATTKVKAAQDKFDAESMILHMTERLSEEKLRALACSYPDLVGLVDDMELDEVKRVLLVKVNEDPSAFVKMSKDDRTKIKYIINHAVQYKKMGWNPGKMTWFKKENGQEKEQLTRVTKGSDPIESLIDFLQGDTTGYREFFEKQVALEKERKKNPASQAAEAV